MTILDDNTIDESYYSFLRLVKLIFHTPLNFASTPVLQTTSLSSVFLRQNAPAQFNPDRVTARKWIKP